MLAEKEQIVRKEGILEFRRPDVSFDDVGGLDRLKAWFTGRREAFSPEGQRFGLRLPRGVVLVGVPGCGKSYRPRRWPRIGTCRCCVWTSAACTARSSANRKPTCERHCTRPSGSVRACCGSTNWKRRSPAWGRQTTAASRSVCLGRSLTWMEERRAPVFVVATANEIRRLPPEFTRKGRFDETFFVDLPGPAERRSIFAIQLRGVQRKATGFDLDRLAQVSQYYSGAEIREAVISGLYRAFDDGARDLTTEDLTVALNEMVPLSRSRADELNWLRQWASINARPA